MSDARTPFEQRGYTGGWTTPTQARAYMDQLLDDVPNITEEYLGDDSAGAPMYAYSVGTGPRPIFFNAQMHGDEVSGREVLYVRLREWATSTDPAIVDYLTRATIHMIPSAHPSNITTRNTPNGVDLNGDSNKVQEPEMFAIHQITKQYQPEVLADLHEAINKVNSDLMTGYTVHPNNHPDINTLSENMSDAVQNAIIDSGSTWETYWNNTIVAQNRLHTTAGALHAVGLLVESRRRHGRGSDRDLDSPQRYQDMATSVDAIITWHDNTMNDIADACQASRDRATQPQDQVTFIDGLETTGPSVMPAPDGYYITSVDRDMISDAEDVFNLDITEQEGRLFVNARHESRWIVHNLMDPYTEIGVITGEQWPQGEFPDVPGVPIPHHVLAYYNDNGTRRKATLTP